MRTLLAGLILITSLSTLAANDCSLNIGGLDFHKRTLTVLKSKYDLTETDAKYNLITQMQCEGMECLGSLVVQEEGKMVDIGEAYGKTFIFGDSAYVKAQTRSARKLQGCL